MLSKTQIGIIVDFIGFFLDLIAISTSYWNKRGYIHTGLFKYCEGDKCSAVAMYGRYKTMQGASCLAFLILLVVTIMAAVYLCKSDLQANLKYKKALGILMIIGGVIAFIGAMCGAGTGASWSLGLAATAGLLCLIAGILTLIPDDSSVTLPS